MSSPFVRKATVPTVITPSVKPALFQLSPKSTQNSNSETSLAVSNLLAAENLNPTAEFLAVDLALTDDDSDVTTPSISLSHATKPTQPILTTLLSSPLVLPSVSSSVPHSASTSTLPLQSFQTTPTTSSSSNFISLLMDNRLLANN